MQEIVEGLRIETSDVTARDGATYYYLAAWRGKALRPFANFRFRDPDYRDRYRDDLKRQHEEANARRAQQTAEKRAARASFDAAAVYPPGTVLTYSWGWEQTNVEFYVVTRASKSSVWLRAIPWATSEPDHFMQGSCTPAVPDSVAYQPGDALHRVSVHTYSGRVSSSVVMPHGVAVKWDGKPERWSSYA